jgi:hypothetical protein
VAGGSGCKMPYRSDMRRGMTCLSMVSDYALINIGG